ncbi:efflux RND transporter periplasmic adaptor subunit [Myxosarcina sp. GI1]|uniref:efflux RND transporter periplasmic adaptor subunit n=1 Tax=Myxosarcina sp. GI1 TaxID=1541065 RepID=UPI000560E6FF
MEIPVIGKVKPSLPWFLGLTTTCLILIGGTTYAILQSSRSKLDIETLTVAATEQNLSVEIEASGRVEPVRSVNISPKEPGRLVKLLVEQGDRVTTAQTLAIMENSEQQVETSRAAAELRQSQAGLSEGKAKIEAEIVRARARLQQARARLQQAQARIPRDIEQTKAQIDAAESRLELVKERRRRNQYLLNEGAIAQDTFDEALNEYQNAQATLTELKQRLQQLQITGDSEIAQLEAEVNEAQTDLNQRQQTAAAEIESLQATTDVSQAALERSQIQYADTIVKAPFDGIVTQRYAVEGAFVTPSTSASSTASASATSILALAQGLEVVAKVPELDVGQLERGQKVRIIADAYPDSVFFGEVAQIAPEAIIEDNVTSFEVKIRLVTGQNKLRSKMNVDVIFLGQELEDTLVVPTVAIVTQKGETGVMLLNAEDEPEFKPVNIGLTIEDKTQVLEGLEAGDRVFIDLPEENRSGGDE